MNVYTVPGSIRIAPNHPVQFVVNVDREQLRVAIEWPVIERWLGQRAEDPNTVRQALLQRQQVIERTVQARVLAHGMPLSGELALTLHDFPRR